MFFLKTVFNMLYTFSTMYTLEKQNAKGKERNPIWIPLLMMKQNLKGDLCFIEGSPSSTQLI